MKRKISILLALMMAVCMVGAVQITAYAATTAKSVSLSTTTYTLSLIHISEPTRPY